MKLKNKYVISNNQINIKFINKKLFLIFLMETKLNFKLMILTFLNLFIFNKCGTEEGTTQKVISCISLIQDQFHHETPRSNTFYQLLATCYLKISPSQLKRIKEQGVQSLKSKEMYDLTNVNFLRKYSESEYKKIADELEKMVIEGNLFTEPDYSKDRYNDDDDDNEKDIEKEKKKENKKENKKESKKEEDKEKKKENETENDKEKEEENDKENEKEKEKGNDDLDDLKFDASEFKFDDSEFKYDDDMYDDYYNNGEYNFDDEFNYDDMYGDYGDNYVDDSIGNEYDEKFANRVVIIFMAVVFLLLMIYLIYLLSDTLKDPSEANKNKKKEEKEEDVESERAVLNKDKKE